MKKVFINQKGFWGDIIFIMAILQKYHKDGYEVIYPLPNQYIEPISVKNYFPTINIISQNGYRQKNFINEGDEVTNLDFHRIYGKHQISGHMRFKYEDLDLPLDMWRDVEITRNHDAETRLFDYLELSDGKKYNFINEFWHGKNTGLLVETGNDYPNINMSFIEGFTLFDWILVMQRAQSIHTVSTSINFFIDLYDMPDDLHIYKRGAQTNHDEYDFLFNKNYVWH